MPSSTGSRRVSRCPTSGASMGSPEDQHPDEQCLVRRSEISLQNTSMHLGTQGLLWLRRIARERDDIDKLLPSRLALCTRLRSARVCGTGAGTSPRCAWLRHTAPEARRLSGDRWPTGRHPARTNAMNSWKSLMLFASCCWSTSLPLEVSSKPAAVAQLMIMSQEVETEKESAVVGALVLVESSSETSSCATFDAVQFRVSSGFCSGFCPRFSSRSSLRVQI